MAGPWEQYATPQSGPWSQFAATSTPPTSAPQGFVANAADFIKSIPTGMLAGISSLPNSNPALSQDEVNADLSARSNARAIAQQQGITHAPQGVAGRMGESVGKFVGSPASYVGPGSLLLKAGGAVLGGLGSQAGEEIGGAPGAVIGSLAGGIAAGKMLGPKAPSAEIPNSYQLKSAADTGYTAARNSDLVLNPNGVSSWAASAERELTNGPKYGFTGGANGTAPKTLDALRTLQSPPPGAVITGANLDTVRRNLGDIAGETKFTAAGPQPTSDAKAAMVALRRLSTYSENIPQSHVVAGDPQAYIDAVKTANANYAAGKRTGLIEKKIADATTNYEGSIAARLDNQIKSQIRPVIKNPKAQRGFTPDEVSAMRGVNQGTVPTRILSELGRGGAGVVPAIAHLAVGIPTAVATGGASIIPQLALAAGLYGARKGAESMTLNQAQNLADMLAKRSPLYQQRLGALPPADTLSNPAQALRGGLLGLIH